MFFFRQTFNMRTKLIHIFSNRFNKISECQNLTKNIHLNYLKKNPKKRFIVLSFCLVAPKLSLSTLNAKSKIIENSNDLISNKIVEKDKNIVFWQILWKLIKPYLTFFIISIVGSIAIAFLNVRIPFYLGSLTNILSNYVSESFSSDQFFNSIKKPALRLITYYILQATFTSITIASLSILGERIAANLKSKVFTSVVSQDIEFFDKNKTGEIVNRIITDIQEFKSSFKIFISQCLRSVTQVLGCGISLYIISPKLSLFLMILVPTIVAVGSFLGRFLREISEICQQQSAKCSAAASEAISCIRTVKASGMEDFEIEMFNKELKKSIFLNERFGICFSIFQGLTNFALNGIILSCLLVGGHLMSNQEISAGDLMSFLVATQTIQKSLTNLSLMFGQYVKFNSSGMRIFEYLEMNPSIVSSHFLKLNPLIGNVTFKNVKFAYPTRTGHFIFNDLNLKLQAGKVTAICGESGSGKSTLAQLLERFYNIDSGSISIDGVDLKNFDLKWLRTEAIGYINQEPTLFATNILENIRYANPKATDEEVYEAAKIANAHNFIKKFPKGYQTIVGERGVTISGGQKQRIAIARAILKNPTILILDEATSALDVESEIAITEALEKLMKDRTVLIIAHRLSTIKKADVIGVISNGKIAEIGNHEELIKKRGLYWNFINKQQNNLKN